MLTQNSTLVLTPKQLRNFRAKIKVSTTHSWNGSPCQEWTASLNNQGYGQFSLNGKIQRAHRIAWMIVHGEPPPDKPFVLHRCDYPRCVEELHLFAGTHQDNMDDKVAKGRGNCGRGDKHGAHTKPESRVRGERHGMSKLQDAVIPEVFRLRATGMTQREIGLVMGVEQQHISRILRGKNRIIQAVLRSNPASQAMIAGKTASFTPTQHTP